MKRAKKIPTTTLLSNLNRAGDKLISRLDQFSMLREIANKRNYSYKVDQIHKKVSEEYEFWTRKQSTNVSIFKLVDLKEDLKYIETQLNATDINKHRVDILAEKYNISYAENNSRTKP